MNFVGKYMVFLKNGSLMKKIYMNIGLFGANFNLILDKKSFIRESILEMRHYFLVVSRYKVFKQMSLIITSLFR